jgi:predicted acyl esterase
VQIEVELILAFGIAKRMECGDLSPLCIPGKPMTIELNNTALTFLKGHRMRLIISSSNYPKYSLNLNDGGPMYRKGEGLVATNSVYAGKHHPSALILPVVAR